VRTQAGVVDRGNADSCVPSIRHDRDPTPTSSKDMPTMRRMGRRACGTPPSRDEGGGDRVVGKQKLQRGCHDGAARIGGRAKPIEGVEVTAMKRPRNAKPGAWQVAISPRFSRPNDAANQLSTTQIKRCAPAEFWQLGGAPGTRSRFCQTDF
jgi:hypothetical protein